jgi:aldose 1-epimerase
MFTITTLKDSSFNKVILTDPSINTVVEILPDCGAILHSFSVINKGAPINVIDGYENTADFTDHVTAKGFKGSKLSPFVCRLKEGTYRFNEKEYTTKKFYLAENAIHGLLYDVPFTVKDTWATEDGAGVSLLYRYNKSDAGYPFIYDCTITYELKKQNYLTVTTTISNKDASIIPIQDGWHPYFTFGGPVNELLFEFQSKEMIEFESRLLPTGKLLPYQEFGSLKKIEATEFDNCFTLDFTECQPLCVLRDPVKRIQLEIYPDKSYPFLQIYIPPHRNSIALENLSSAPDGFNNGMGLKTIPPGLSENFVTTYKITQLD